ncbi:hypothetical protein SCOCK_70076 [Actinacidiphila cocklensis]|uniref:Uncharacterized protein n=1 Tax=Actinacidiphila cocklensis TaxID=887465 RepID=A0A9W4E2S5_9ACTN|nr:hypothetical protein SCOCK_70076 [Actinacidiphila cocklensis]
MHAFTHTFTYHVLVHALRHALTPDLRGCNIYPSHALVDETNSRISPVRADSSIRAAFVFRIPASIRGLAISGTWDRRRPEHGRGALLRHHS